MSSSRPESVSSALAHLRRLKAEAAMTSREVAEGFAGPAAQAFMTHYREHGESLRDAVTLLCEVATLPNEEAARAGVAALFPSIIEPLGDAFDPAACRVYARLFAQVIEFCRGLPEGKPLDQALSEFALHSERDLLDRVERVTRITPFTAGEAVVRKVLVLSRVTLGADVAVTSVVLEKMKRRFPCAEIVFLANQGAWQLFGGDPRLTVRSLNYRRSGALLSRLLSWLEVVENVGTEAQGLATSQFLVIDPDSRLTQLGLLPVVRHDSSYLFFDSRSFRAPGVEPLGQLTGAWLTRVLGGDEEIFPSVSPPETDAAWARALTDPLRKAGRYLVCVNLGVGENERKRLPDPFEEELLRALAAEGAMVILDRGAGQDEVSRANALIRRLAAHGHRVADLTVGHAAERLDTVEVIAWKGGIGRLAALIGESHLYIGYDSAGQHIAAAQGVPTIDIFAGYTSPMMPRRWRPYGRGPVDLVTVAEGQGADPRQVLGEAFRLYRQHRAAYSR